MNDLQRLKEFQEEFDSRHSGKFDWNEKITIDNVDKLLFVVASMCGEAGEAINITKKIVRGDMLLEEAKDALVEEITDVFIYILKLSYQLDFDLEKSYFEKMEFNKARFRNFEKSDS